LVKFILLLFFKLRSLQYFMYINLNKHTIFWTLIVLILLGSTKLIASSSFDTEKISMDKKTSSLFGFENKNKIIIDSNFKINDVILDIQDVDFRIIATSIILEGDHKINLHNVELILEGFSGMLDVKKAGIGLEGSFKRIYNNDLQIDSMKDSLIFVTEGNITTNKIRFSDFDAKAQGSVNLQEGKFIFELADESISLKEFDGDFSVSNYPNIVKMKGDVKSVYSNNNFLNLFINLGEKG
jgi:hypothetical protein